MDAPWPAQPPADPDAGGAPPPWPPAGGVVPPIVRGSAAPTGTGFPAVTPPGRPSGGYPAVGTRPTGAYPAAGQRPSGSVPVVAPARQTGRHAQRPTGAYALPPSTASPGAYGAGTAAASGGAAPSTGHLRAVSALPAEGDEIDGYRILATIGRGSMGRVYRARDRMGRDVALKVILGEQADAEGVQRFAREGQAMAAVPRHKNVVNVHSTGAARGLPYLVLDLVEGESLADVLKRGSLRVVDAVGMTMKLARAVHHVHASGVLHRDLKPANILIRKEDGEPVLSDFGMAGLRGADRLTRTGDLVGTPLYMPPEQVLGVVRKIDARSDVWALGAMLYEMLAGAPPFTGRTLVDVSRAITANEPAPVEGVDAGLMGIVRRSLAKRQEDRFQTAGELADALAAWGAGNAPPPPPPPPRASRLTLVLVAAAALGVIAGGAALVVAARRARAARDAAPDPAPPTTTSTEVAPATPSLGTLAPIVEQVRAGRALAAIGAINQHRELRSDEERAAARLADEAVRAHARALLEVPSRDEEELRSTLKVLARLRELADMQPSSDPVVDVVLARVTERMTQLARTGEGGDPADDAALLEHLVGARLLPGDVVGADAAFEAVKEAYFYSRRLENRDYQRLLLCMVRLDVDLFHEHVVRVGPLPSDLKRGAAAEFLDLRIRNEVGADRRESDPQRDQERLAARNKNAAAMLALVEGPRAAELGPVTRARGLTEGAVAARSFRDRLALLDRAAELDPRTPFPLLQKAVLLHELAGGPDERRQAQTDRGPADLREEAVVAAVEALRRLGRDGYADRTSLRRWQGATFYRSLFDVFVAAGDLTRAREVVEQMAAVYPEEDDLQKLRATLSELEARARGSRASDF